MSNWSLRIVYITREYACICVLAKWLTLCWVGCETFVYSVNLHVECLYFLFVHICTVMLTAKTACVIYIMKLQCVCVCVCVHVRSCVCACVCLVDRWKYPSVTLVASPTALCLSCTTAHDSQRCFNILLKQLAKVSCLVFTCFIFMSDSHILRLSMCRLDESCLFIGTVDHLFIYGENLPVYNQL